VGRREASAPGAARAGDDVAPKTALPPPPPPPSQHPPAPSIASLMGALAHLSAQLAAAAVAQEAATTTAVAAPQPPPPPRPPPLPPPGPRPPGLLRAYSSKWRYVVREKGRWLAIVSTPEGAGRSPTGAGSGAAAGDQGGNASGAPPAAAAAAAASRFPLLERVRAGRWGTAEQAAAAADIGRLSCGHPPINHTAPGLYEGAGLDVAALVDAGPAWVAAACRLACGAKQKASGRQPRPDIQALAAVLGPIVWAVGAAADRAGGAERGRGGCEQLGHPSGWRGPNALPGETAATAAAGAAAAAAGPLQPRGGEQMQQMRPLKRRHTGGGVGACAAPPPPPGDEEQQQTTAAPRPPPSQRPAGRPLHREESGPDRGRPVALPRLATQAPPWPADAYF